ncbi:unnamed protein product, partial [marine sediment metagenome]
QNNKLPRGDSQAVNGGGLKIYAEKLNKGPDKQSVP